MISGMRAPGERFFKPIILISAYLYMFAFTSCSMKYPVPIPGTGDLISHSFGCDCTLTFVSGIANWTPQEHLSLRILEEDKSVIDNKTHRRNEFNAFNAFSVVNVMHKQIEILYCRDLTGRPWPSETRERLNSHISAISQTQDWTRCPHSGKHSPTTSSSISR